MEEYVGLDVSQKTTVVCVLDAQGRRVWAGRCASTPEAIGATVRAKAPGATRVGLETGPLPTWLYHGLKALGVPVVCLDARHAKAALSMQINKSDRNDAEGLAQIVRTGWYREVHVKSEATHLVRTLLQTRLQLTNMRRDVSNQIRGSLKTFGVVLPEAGGRRFEQVVREAAEGRPELHARLGLAGPAHDLARPQAVRRGQDDPRSPDVLLRAVPVRHHRLQTGTVGGAHLDTDPFAHPCNVGTRVADGNLPSDQIH